MEATLARDVDAVLVPSGMPIVIPAGTRVRIVQDAGAVTVDTGGNLARIEEKDREALGLPEAAPAPAAAEPPADREEAERRAWEALKRCYDPEIPINIVDLGLVYELRIEEAGDGFRAHVRMTLTAPGCPVAPMIVEDVRRKLLEAGLAEAQVELVFDPPWDRSRMSDEAKLRLGWL